MPSNKIREFYPLQLKPYEKYREIKRHDFFFHCPISWLVLLWAVVDSLYAAVGCIIPMQVVRSVVVIVLIISIFFF